MVKNANEIKFRCSSLGYLMTESRSKTDPISETTKTHLTDVFVSAKYGRNTDIESKYTMKGNMVEEDSITLFSRLTKTVFKKNDLRIENDFIIGTPDLFIGETIQSAKEIIDLKSSWDIYTFFRNNTNKLNKMYYWQLQGYMALTGAKSAKLVYCLVNTPEVFINDAKKRLYWKMNIIDDVDTDYQKACEEIEKLSIYDDIPMDERIITIDIERNDYDIQSIYNKVEMARLYMNNNLFQIYS